MINLYQNLYTNGQDNVHETRIEMSGLSTKNLIIQMEVGNRVVEHREPESK